MLLRLTATLEIDHSEDMRPSGVRQPLTTTGGSVFIFSFVKEEMGGGGGGSHECT